MEIKEFLCDLGKNGVSEWIIRNLEEDLNFEENENILRKYTDNMKDRDIVIKALEISKKAHEGQFQKRAKDLEGLDNIPYVNHPIQVAIMALKKNLSSETVQGGLLHDVVEDTDWTLEDLKKEGFNEKVLAIVNDVTRSKEEDRKTYMERVRGLKGESKMIKCFDRYHNLLRCFSIKDVKFLDRYIKESEEIYVPAFSKLSELSDTSESFNKILKEIKKFRDSLL